MSELSAPVTICLIETVTGADPCRDGDDKFIETFDHYFKCYLKCRNIALFNLVGQCLSLILYNVHCSCFLFM